VSRKVGLLLFVLALVVGALVGVVVGSIAAADVVVNPFAGDWSTFSGAGTLHLQVVDASIGQAAIQSYAPGTSCPSGATYYTGSYTSGSASDSGQTAGCSDVSGTQLSGGYKSGIGPQNGTFNVTVSSDFISFSGSYHENSDNTGGSYPGAFTGDFAGSGRTQPSPPPPTTTTSPPPGAFTATVSAITGDVEWRSRGGDLKPLSVGQVLAIGDEILTGPLSSVTIAGSDGSIMSLDRPLMQVRIASIDTSEKRLHLQMQMKMGQITEHLKRQEGIEPDFSVKTPTAVAGVRGSQMTVSYDPGRRVTSVSVISDQATVQPLAYSPMSPGTAPVGAWTPGASTAAPQTVLQGETLRVGQAGVIVTNLAKAIPGAKVLRAGPLSVTVPGSISLTTLRGSRCVRVDAAASGKTRGGLRIVASKRVFGSVSLSLVKGASRALCIAKPDFVGKLAPGKTLAVMLSSTAHDTAHGRITLTH
jgi:hypothetical protein